MGSFDGPAAPWYIIAAWLILPFVAVIVCVIAKDAKSALRIPGWLAWWGACLTMVAAWEAVVLIARAFTSATGPSLGGALLAGIVYFVTSPTLIVLATSWGGGASRQPEAGAAT